jgi:hypothetical protein
MTAYDNPILLFFAIVCLAAIIFWVLKYYKQLSFAALVVVVLVGGAAALYGGLVVVAMIGSAAYEEYTAKQCLTAHERRARALAAPDDYFGRQLRDAAVEEAKSCAEIASKREIRTAKPQAD